MMCAEPRIHVCDTGWVPVQTYLWVKTCWVNYMCNNRSGFGINTNYDVYCVLHTHEIEHHGKYVLKLEILLFHIPHV